MTKYHGALVNPNKGCALLVGYVGTRRADDYYHTVCGNQVVHNHLLL